MSKKSALEAPTLLVAFLVHAAWFAATWLAGHASWPFFLAVAPLGALVVAWHGSLQHEIVHGHPTRARWVNTLLASLPMGLWLPFGVYREQHLRHHGSELTDPADDPESFYVSRAWWARAGRVRRALASAQMTLAGRLVLGPATAVCRFLAGELRAILRGDLRHARAWAAHLAGVALVVLWLDRAGLSIERYVLFFAYPGFALTLVRSFAEHRAADEHRSAIVLAGPVARLLYLNNNFHAAHHEAPALAWYELPARGRELAGANGGFVIPGYLWLAARYAFKARDLPVHPGGAQ
jgi:fatty acid desaturase